MNLTIHLDTVSQETQVPVVTKKLTIR